MITSFFALFLLLVFSALFSAVETSITAIGHGRIIALQEEFRWYKRLFDWLLKDAQKALTVCVILNNVLNISASVLATALGILLFGEGSAFFVVPIMTVLIVIFAEIFPKNVAIIYPDKILLVLLPLLRLLSIILIPFIFIMQETVRFIGMAFKMDLKHQQVFVTRDEIERMVSIGEESGVFEEVERKMIHGVITFEETRAYEIMVPRTDMVAISKDEPVSDAIPIFIEMGHSRLPVYNEKPDSIVGILYVKDTLKYLTNGQNDIIIEEIMREPMFVPDSIRTDDLFKLMKKERVHIAVVVDEYGGVAGIVTMEDIIEEIVGEIQDEYDQETPDIEPEDEGIWRVNGLMSLEDLSEVLSYPFESEDAESLGGLVLSLAGKIPQDGEKFCYGDWIIEVIEMEDHRIKSLRLWKDSDQLPVDSDQ
ncbi:MAG: hemolysin family protein [Synergistaceae bacterium]|nr:hemolysin family protein [Synergistaceae bacterium]